MKLTDEERELLRYCISGEIADTESAIHDEVGELYHDGMAFIAKLKTLAEKLA